VIKDDEILCLVGFVMREGILVILGGWKGKDRDDDLFQSLFPIINVDLTAQLSRIDAEIYVAQGNE
jgi:hypothetical protein